MTTLSDWAVCPDHACSHAEPVEVDVVQLGQQTALSFWCPNCEYGGLEDDLRWWVKCPECDEIEPELPIDRVSGTVTSQGDVRFECDGCGERFQKSPETKWDANTPESE